MIKLNDILQWLGAGFIILGHVFNSIGPEMYPWNIAVFAAGTILFLTWALRVSNKPQAVVNIVAMVIAFIGLYKAFL
jgi:hypothetical protein